jgi:hypothetical protein
VTAAACHDVLGWQRQAQLRLVLALAPEPPTAAIWAIEQALDDAREMVAAGHIPPTALEVTQ